MPRNYYAKQNDKLRPFRATLLDAEKEPIDLTEADSVELHIGYHGAPDNAIVSRAAAILDPPTAGRIQVYLTQEELTTSGEYDVEVQINWVGGGIETVPSKEGQNKAIISPEVA